MLVSAAQCCVAVQAADNGIAGTQATLMDNLPHERDIDESKVVMRLQQGSNLVVKFEDSYASRDLLNMLPLRIDLDTNGAGGLAFSLNKGLESDGDDMLSDVVAGDVVYDPQTRRVVFVLVDSPELTGSILIGKISEKAVKTLINYKPTVAFLEAHDTEE